MLFFLIYFIWEDLLTTLYEIQQAYLFDWKCQLLKQLLPDYFIPLLIFASYLIYPEKWPLTAMSCPKSKSQEVETGIQRSKLEELSSVNTAYFFTKKNKSKCRHYTEYFVMDQKVQHSVNSVSPTFLCISILFNLTFYMCIKHTKNGICKRTFHYGKQSVSLPVAGSIKKIESYFNFVDIYKGDFWLKEAVSL